MPAAFLCEKSWQRKNLKLTFPGCVFLLPDSRFSLLCGARYAFLSAKTTFSDCKTVFLKLQDWLFCRARLTILASKIDYLALSSEWKNCFCVSNALDYNALAKIRHNSSVRSHFSPCRFLFDSREFQVTSSCRYDNSFLLCLTFCKKYILLLQNVCVSQILLLPLHCDSRVWHVIYVTTLTLVKFCPWSVRCQRTCRIQSCYKGCRESSGESNCEKVCPLCRLGIVCRWYGSLSFRIIIVFMRHYLWITVSVLVLLLTIYDRVQVSRKYKNDSRFYSLYKKRSNICMLIYLLLLALFFFSKPW